jgi:hypothetical protein
MDTPGPYDSLDPAAAPPAGPPGRAPVEERRDPGEASHGRPPLPPAAVAVEPEDEPTTGVDDASERLPGWNWSAFLVPMLFAIVNRLWWWLAVAAVPAVAATFDLLPRNLLGPVQTAISVMFARIGNPYAWRARQWDDMAHFRRVQRMAGWVALAITVVIVSIVVVQVASDPIARLPEAAGEPTPYADHGVTLTVPAGWIVDQGGGTLTGVDRLRDTGFWLDGFLGPGTTEFAMLTASDAGASFTRQDLETHAGELATALGAYGPLVGEPRILTVGTYPAVRFDSTREGDDTVRLHSLIVYVGEIQVFATCRSTEAGTSSASACDDLLSSIGVQDAEAVSSSAP